MTPTPTQEPVTMAYGVVIPRPHPDPEPQKHPVPETKNYPSCLSIDIDVRGTIQSLEGASTIEIFFIDTFKNSSLIT